MNLMQIFSISSIFVLATLVFFIFFTIKIETESKILKRKLIITIIAGIFTVGFYTLFQLSETYKYAFLFDTFYFCSIDWIIYLMLSFSITFAKRKSRFHFRTLLFVACLVDTIILLINLKTNHNFDLKMLIFGDFQQYWASSIKPFHFIHLGLCYLMIIASFAVLIVATKKAPSFYKKKYAFLLIAYAVVIVVNLICYSLSLPIDFSVLLYAVLVSFICYFALYSFPNLLINNILNNLNEKIDDGIIFFEKNNKYYYSNNAARLLFEKNGKFSKKIVEDYSIAWKSLHIENEKGIDTFIIDGKDKRFTVEYQSIISDEEIEIGTIFKFTDKTDEINEINKESYLATHDELTGLYNRTGFFEAVEELQIRQANKGIEYIMLSSNIKDFKLINEVFGEKIGDEVLKKQAELVRSFSHSDTLCGRISDDKFAMFLKKSYFDKEVFEKAFKEMEKITRSIDIENYYRLNIKIGIYESKFSLLENPQKMYDKAMISSEQILNDYQKTFALYDESMVKKMMIEKIVLNEFENALNAKQFCIYLQPQIGKNGTQFGCEALARWVYPERGELVRNGVELCDGVILPENFINILEKTGLIYKLDMFIWEEVAKKIQEWNQNGYKDKSISVNVSPKDIFYIDICKTFVDLTKKYDIDPKNLNIEFTETVFVEDFAKAKNILEKLQSYGFKIEIDDFGSGYSSLNMLKDINADVLKIDRTFLDAESTDERNQTILKTIISMSKSLGMEVLTEGIETAEQIHRLNELGCENFQGYYFAKPMDVESFEKEYL